MQVHLMSKWWTVLTRKKGYTLTKKVATQIKARLYGGSTFDLEILKSIWGHQCNRVFYKDVLQTRGWNGTALKLITIQVFWKLVLLSVIQLLLSDTLLFALHVSVCQRAGLTSSTAQTHILPCWLTPLFITLCSIKKFTIRSPVERNVIKTTFHRWKTFSKAVGLF